jgi:D-alanine transaminase
MIEVAYVNGDFVEPGKAVVSIEDRGFLFADGVYEVVASYDTRPFALERHLRRLQRSLNELQIRLDVEGYGVGKVVDEAIRRSSSADTLIYIQITRGVAPRRHEFPDPSTQPTVVITISPLSPLPDEWAAEGVKCVTVPNQRWGRCDIKTVALLPNVLARQQAASSGAFEALFVDADRRVVEGASTSSFCVCEGLVRTTPLAPSILPGITRELILECAGEMGIDVREEDTYLDAYLSAEEVFVAGTSIDTLGVVQLDDQVIGSGKPGPITCQLGEALLQMRGAVVETELPRS